MTEGTTCVVCEIEREATQLHRCRCCRRMYCNDCAFTSKMGKFCTKECADIIFYGDTEDDEPSERNDVD